jgi:hypothetical protein
MPALGIPEYSRVKRRQAHDTALHQKDSREFRATPTCGRCENIRRAKSGRGYHLIIYDFRPINQPVSKNKKS